jgi:hypothetical protein
MELTGPDGKPCLYELVGADGEPDIQPVTIDLLPSNSDQGVAVNRKNLNRRLTSKRPTDADILESEQTELLVACTTGWSGMTMGGQPFPYSPNNARLLYTDQRFSFIRAQANAFIADAANFTKR